MNGGLANLAYLASGVRNYGLKPVLGGPRGRWEFQFILSGNARPSRVESPVVKVKRPRLYVSHPQLPHGWIDQRDGVSEVLVLQFLEIPDELASCIDSTKPLVVMPTAGDVSRVVRDAGLLAAGASGGDARVSLRCRRLLADLCLLALGGDVVVSGRNNAVNRVDWAMHWFEENLTGNPTVENAARAAGVSAAHLRRLFAEAGRPSPQAELLRLRMEAAERCLREGRSQKEVAELFGFSEVSAFARAFRIAHGAAPGRWLRSMPAGR